MTSFCPGRLSPFLNTRFCHRGGGEIVDAYTGIDLFSHELAPAYLNVQRLYNLMLDAPCMVVASPPWRDHEQRFVSMALLLGFLMDNMANSIPLKTKKRSISAGD